MKERNIYSIDPRVLQKGYTNLNRGHANLVNRKAICRFKAHEDGYWTIVSGDGSSRQYGKRLKIEKEQMKQMKLPTKEVYLLTREIQPNGNQLVFSYAHIHEKERLEKIAVQNSVGTSLGEVELSYSPEGCCVTTPYGDKVTYSQKEYSDGEYKFLKTVKSSRKGTSTFRTKKIHHQRKVVEVIKNDKSLIKVDYQEDGKVKWLSKPLGSGGEEVKTHEFHYEPNTTYVRNALGHLKVYHFDSHQRLSHVMDLNNHRHTLRTEHYEWSKREGEEGWLSSKSIGIGHRIFHLKTYRYDKRGNVIRTTLYGNLTGEKQETFGPHHKKEMDSYAIDYTYTDDGRNLLSEKITQDGYSTRYDYRPGTDLCLRILHKYDGKIQEREFFNYDENGQLTVAVEDDGTSEA